MLPLAAHTLKLEQYREDEHGPCTWMACKFVNRSIFFNTNVFTKQKQTQTDIENKLTVTKGERGEGGIN